MSSSSVSRTVDDAGESGEGRSRKRKRSTKEHDAAASSSTPPPPPPPPQHSAPTLPDTIRGKPLEPSSLAYFRSLHSSLQAAADSGTDVQLMVAAAFGELKGLEYRLLVNKHGSRCVEALIAHSTPSQLSTLLSATQSAAFALLIDRNASHPMQQLIERLPRLLLDEQRAGKQDEAGSLSSSLLAFCQSLAEPPTPEQSAAAASQLSAPPASCWPLLMMQEQGSYAVRSLARLMSGAIDIGGQADKERRPAGPSGAAGSVPPSSVSHVSFLRPVLSALVDSVVGLKEADRIELAFHATAAPALSELLATLSGHPHYHSLLESLLLSMLLTDDDRSQSEAVSVSSRGVSHAAQMMRHRAGSHLFEHILRATRQLPATPTGSTGAAAARLTFATLVRDTLQGDMAELAVHSTGNHVLQTALTLCTHNEQHFVKKACTTLGAMCQRLIESNRVGVIWRLLQASAFVSQKRRDRLVAQLQQSLQAEDGKQLLHALLTINLNRATATTEGEQATDDTDEKEQPATVVSDQPATSSPSLWSSSSRVSYFGSLLLQSLLSLPLSDTSLSTALVSLSTDDLYRLACDGSGGPVLECLLRVHTATSFSHPLSTQQRLIDALLPRVTELALSASGSYVVERMYGAADVQRKRVIAESLAKDEKRLKHSKPASMLMRRCRVKQIKTSNKDWMVAEGARKRKAELFSDILNG